MRRDLRFYLRKAAQGVIASIVILAIIFMIDRGEMVQELLLYEILPNYNMGEEKLNTDEKPRADDPKPEVIEERKPEYIEIIETVLESGNTDSQKTQNMPEASGLPDIQPVETPSFTVTEVELTHVEPGAGIIGLDDVIYQPESFTTDIEGHFSDSPLVDMEKLKDMNFLLNNFYLVDPKTGLRDGLIDPVAFLSADMRLKPGVDGPQVLIFHTHPQEMFKDSEGVMDGIIGAGELLCQILEAKYGIKTIHDMSRYDLVDGQSHILGAYERMEPSVMKILRDNPTIEVAIDLHRDGVKESIHLVETINGKPTAQIMFFNGLSTTKEGGTLRDISSLPNINLKANLSFSFQMQLAANELFAGFTRKVYLQAYRYSLHMLPKSLLVEVGAQTNTKEEAFNAMEPLADVLARVVLKR